MSVFQKLLFLAISVPVVVIQCTFETDFEQPLVMECISEKIDTVLPWPQLIFVFSSPLKDSTIELSLLPDPGPVFYNYLTQSKDTLHFLVTGTLSGQRDYSLSLKTSIVAENGSILYPEDALFSFTTWPSELEPNNRIELCDTLVNICYGIITPVNDSDYYFFYDTTATNLYLKCHSRISGIIVLNAQGQEVFSQHDINDLKQFPLNDNLSMPLYIKIFSLLDTDARYELGLSYEE